MSSLKYNPIIKNISLKDIKPYSNNPRKKQNIKKVVNSIKEFGFQQPIVVDKKNIIIVGHSRYEAGKELGLDKVPVIIADLSPVKAKAYRIADNRINQDSEWDFSKLTLEFKDISKLDFNLDSLGFEKNELDDLIIDEVKGFTDDDAVPDKPKKPKSKLGEIYQLGHHRVMCGDATKEEDINKLMDGNKADMVFTDPPYNVDYSGRGKNNLGKIKNDNQNVDNFNQFLLDAFSLIYDNLKSLSLIYVCHPDSHSKPKIAFETAFDQYFNKSSTIIWDKGNAGMGWQDYRSQHEPLLYGWKKGNGKHNFYGDRTQTSVWYLKRDSVANYSHPTQKPVALSSKAILNSCKKNEIVFDPFLGSGSTLIACEKLNRKFYGLELDPIYVDVIIKRWEDYTGKSSKKI